ncbi:glycosyltransferase [Xanthomarina sp. GH4-25]|uniref:glycosyltransferase n=1 Tax=Xanthomarina sp. GH4-25 TaxID=3349335 RepID=UPI003878341D
MPLKNKTLKSPLISIIIPCYNVEKYIYKGLESILNQTYSNWECFIVNDGSTDNTENKIKEWVNKDKRFKLISQENQGVSAARNTGLKQAKGDCIYFFDPDDIIAKNCLKSLIKLYQPDIDIVVGKNAEVIGQTTTNSKTLEHGIITDKVFRNDNYIELALKSPFLTVCWNNLYNAEFIFSNNLRFKEGIVHEDELWYFETLHLAKTVVFNSNTTYYYNVGNQNSITKNYGLNNLKSYITVIEDIYKKYYISENNKQSKLIIGTYILNLQIPVVSAFFRFIKKNKKTPFKSEGVFLIKKHIKNHKINKYYHIDSKKSKQFKLFIKYGLIDPEKTFKLIRNTNKKNILKSFENLYLKLLLKKNLVST